MEKRPTCQMHGLYRAIATSAASVVALCFTAGAFGVRINTSYSLPMGLYIESGAADAPFVEFCPTGRFAEESRDRGEPGDSRARTALFPS